MRRIWTSTALNEYLDFPHVGQVAVVQRETDLLKSGKKRAERAYLITSLSPEQASPERLLHINRGHWGIENRLHWVRDVTYDEDRSQIRTGNGPAMMAGLRNFAISLMRLMDCKNIAAQTRHFAARSHMTLNLLRL